MAVEVLGVAVSRADLPQVSGKVTARCWQDGLRVFCSIFGAISGPSSSIWHRTQARESVRRDLEFQE